MGTAIDLLVGKTPTKQIAATKQVKPTSAIDKLLESHYQAPITIPKQGVMANLPAAVGETVSGFIKGLAKPFVEAGVSAYNVGKQIISGGEQLEQPRNVPLYGEAEPLFTGKETLKEFTQKVVGTGLEVAPYFAAMPELKSTGKILNEIGSRPLSQITQQEAKQFITAYARRVGATAGTLGPTFGLGQSIKEGADLKQTAKNIAVATASVAALETALAPIMGRLKTTEKTGKIKAEINPEVKIPEIKPETTVPEVKPISAIDKLVQEKVIKPEIQPTTPPEIALVTPEIKTSKLASGVEQKAIEAGLTERFEGKPEYAVVNVADQARVATELIKTNPQRAIKIAMGQEIPPEGLLPESVFTAVEKSAIRSGDVATLRELATSSSLTSEATGMGQRLRMLAEQDPYSPVGAIQDITKIKQTILEKKIGKSYDKIKSEQVAKLKETINSEKKINPTKVTKDTVMAFIKSIEC
jgi:hypothetical protein